MKQIPDIKGFVFSRLTVIEFTHFNKDGRACFDCICECGIIKNISSKNLKNGNTRSCGCLSIESSRSPKTHGGCCKETKIEHDTYRSMIDRCTKETHRFYYNYGGRGITVCKEWLDDFNCFYKDMGKRPSKKHTLERNENDKGYSKENCRWATWQEQQNNRRTNVFVKFEGKELTVSQWAKELKINYAKLSARIRNKWPVEKALTT